MRNEMPASMWSRRDTRLSVSTSGRYLVDEDGAPFFYLADTAWTLLKRLDHAEVDRYFANRVAKGFSVIQAYVLRGLAVPNLEGQFPLIDSDPTRLNEGFFGNVDYIVDRANDLGLVMGLVATMGEHVHSKRARSERYRNDEQIFNVVNAFAYGELLGVRYKRNCVIWLLGGDHSPTAEDVAIWDAMGRGLKAGSDGTHLVSYHSSGGHSSSEHFHQRWWLDFNTVQSHHRSADPNYRYISTDYGLEPIKPTLDMEARYEDIPDGLLDGKIDAVGRIDAFQVREAAYWAVFAGACGHGYGHNDVWQMADVGKVDSSLDYSFPLLPPTNEWHISIDSAGAFGMAYMRGLLESRPWYTMEPDQSVIVAGQGEDEDHVQASRARDGGFIVAYLPSGSPVSIRMDGIAGETVRALWYDPRSGTFSEIGSYPSVGTQKFVPPTSGPGNDWVLVLDDARRDYPAT